MGPAAALNPIILHTFVAFVNKKLPALLAKVAKPCPELANVAPGFEKNAMTCSLAYVIFEIVLPVTSAAAEPFSKNTLTPRAAP